MAIVKIPALMRDLTGGESEIVSDGGTVRELIENLSSRYPGFGNRLIIDGVLKPGISISVNGRISILGMHERINSSDRILILHTVGGG